MRSVADLKLEDRDLDSLYKVPDGLGSPHSDMEKIGNALLPIDRAHILSEELLRQASERGYCAGS